jgi:hypothetical protein
MTKLTLLIFAVLFAATQINAQIAREIPEKPTKVFNGPTGHGFGAVLSSSNGKGLAYRYWKSKYGFHASFFPAANNDNKYYNGGLTGYCKLKEYEMGSLFLHAGIEYQYSSSPESFNSGPYPAPIEEYVLTTRGWNIGAGPGIHVFQKFLSMDIYLGYGAYSRDNSSSFDGYEPKDDFIMTLTGGVAFFLEL